MIISSSRNSSLKKKKTKTQYLLFKGLVRQTQVIKRATVSIGSETEVK